MEILNNLNLLSVGVAIAATAVLGFVVFLNNRGSATNRNFLYLSLVAIVWSTVNYLDYQFTSPGLVLWFLRFEVFFAVWYSFFIFQLLFVFPAETVKFSNRYRFILVPIVAIVSLINLTPLVFSSIAQLSAPGQVSTATVGPGIYLFLAMIISLFGAGFFLLVRKLRRAQGIERAQFRFVFIGLITTFALYIVFNLILPAIFLDVRFIPLSAIFVFPFVAFTAYAIFKHHLLSVKVISTEILAFALTIVVFSEIIFSQSITEKLFRSGEFVLVLVVSIFLIRSVLREVEQREELQRLNVQIEEANKQLGELSRFKSELLSLASHQLRSPLAAIKGFASLIADGTYGAVELRTKEALVKIQHSADELIGLINTLLDVRKVEEGRMDYKFASTRVDVMAHDVVELLRPLAEQKHLELTFTSSDIPLFVNADAEKLKQVIQNLVDNALKYTPTGFVHVALTSADGKAILSVADSGLGISAILLPQLFEEYMRDERVKKQIRGTGLGLYIARKITESHGGTISAASPGEGQGSTFSVSLPLIPTPPSNA